MANICVHHVDIVEILPTAEVDDEIAKVQAKMRDDFVPWIPNNIKSTIIRIAPDEVPMTGTFVANTTAIKGVFQRISAQFAKMFKRKAFLHWYKGEGMDEMEFQESDKNLRDLVTEYQDKQDAQVDANAAENADAEDAGGDQENNEEQQNDDNEENQDNNEQVDDA